MRNKEKDKITGAARYQHNRADILKKHKIRYKEDSEFRKSKKDIGRRWREINPERVKEREVLRYLADKDAIREKNRKWRKSNPERSKALWHRHQTKKRLAGGSFTADEWQTLCKNAKYKCLCCGKRRKLEADHVVPVAHGGTSNISNIQPLCRICNAKKNTKHTDYRERRQHG